MTIDVGYLKDKLREIRASRLDPDGEITVFVELSVREPDEACLQQLQAAGLTIREVIGNKVVGRIDSESAKSLELLSVVTNVERSVKLKFH